MNILPQADNKKYIEDIHLAPSANLVCHWLGLSQALLIASFWLFYNQGDLAINMIKVILVKSLILKSIDLLPCSRASFGLISSVIGVIFLKTGIQIDGLPRSSFSRYLCGCDGGVQLVGNVASGSWEVPQILPLLPSHHLPSPHCPSKPNHRHTKGLKTGNCSDK